MSINCLHPALGLSTVLLLGALATQCNRAGGILPAGRSRRRRSSKHPLGAGLADGRTGAGADPAARCRDYTFTLIKRERRKGRLKPYEFIDAKVRHADDQQGVPFSVYLNFLKPSSVAGREVLYLEGRNANKMLIRRGGRRLAYVTTYMDPRSKVALDENRYPVTELGFVTMIERLCEVMREDLQHGECEVKFFKNAKVGDSVCTRVVVEHPYPRDYFRFHRAVVFIDEDRGLPLAYGSYQWPQTPGGKPILVEEYLHTKVQLNVGLTDQDFSRDNPGYGFIRQENVVAQD